MCSDHLANRVGVHKTSEKHERYEMVVENFGVEVQVEWDKSPGNEEWDESDKGVSRFVASSTTCLDNVLGTGRSASVQRD